MADLVVKIEVPLNKTRYIFVPETGVLSAAEESALMDKAPDRYMNSHGAKVLGKSHQKRDPNILKQD